MRINGTLRNAVQPLEFTRGAQVIALNVQVQEHKWYNQCQEWRGGKGNDGKTANDFGGVREEHVETTGQHLVDAINLKL